MYFRQWLFRSKSIRKLKFQHQMDSRIKLSILLISCKCNAESLQHFWLEIILHLTLCDNVLIMAITLSSWMRVDTLIAIQMHANFQKNTFVSIWIMFSKLPFRNEAFQNDTWTSYRSFLLNEKNLANLIIGIIAMLWRKIFLQHLALFV